MSLSFRESLGLCFLYDAEMFWRKLIPAFLILPLSAQTLRVIDFYEPKREKMAEFRSAIADFNAVMRKAGGTDWYTIWSSLSGRSEYIRIQDYEHWADLDKPPKISTQNNAELAVADQRIRDANQSSRRVIVDSVLGASLVLGDPSPMLITRWVTPLPGRGPDYTSLFKSDLLPAISKAGVKTFSMWQVRFGGERSQFLELVPIEDWATFDKPDRIAAAMGHSAYDQFQTKIRPMLAEVRLDAYRFRAELSYLPPKK
jgi:hypothetical protein